MKNLKRALSFALATVMLIGMMVVGASAADFGDADEIVNTEAVNTMVALGVIKGKDDGNFDPEGIVTRAEMAKIIAVMLNGGKDIVGVTKPTPTYSDIKGHWAEGYIEYCSALEIIAGRGDGTFDPNSTVTATEAAKMFLVALGYDSDVFMFTGASWAINVNAKANEIRLYDEIEHITVDEGMTRDNAAQMAYNTLEAKMMVKGYDKVLSNGEISYNYNLGDKTFLNEKFNGKTFIGTFTGNSDIYSSIKDGQVRISGVLTTDAEGTPNRTATLTADLDIAEIGEEFKVIYKEGQGGTANRPDDKDTIYGVFNTKSVEVVTATKADVKDQKSSDAEIKVGADTYATEDVVVVYTNYISTGTAYAANNGTSSSNSSLTGALKAQSADAFKLVINDDGKVESVYVTTYDAGTVTAVTSTKVTISGVGSIVIEDNDIYEGIAKDDVVVYTKFYDTDKDKAYFTVTKAESVTGELTGYKLDSGNYVNVVVDGTTYKTHEPATALLDLTDDEITTPAATDIGTDVCVYLVNGMAVALQEIGDGASQYAVVTNSNTGVLNNELNPLKVVILQADGTKATKIVHKDSTTNGSTAVTNSNIGAGKLVKYTTVGEDQIKITLVQSTAVNGSWDSDSKTLTNNTASPATTAVAAKDAAAFINVGGTYYAYNLRDLKDMTSAYTRYITNSDGLVVALYMSQSTRPGGATSNTLYGIVSAYVGVRSIEDTTYYQYTIALSEDESVTVYADDNSSISLGDVVYFEKSADDCYDASAEFIKVTSTAVAVKNYDASNHLITYYTATSRADITEAFAGSGVASATVADDVVIVYIDKNGKKAGEATGVTAFDATTGYANAYIVDTDSTPDGIIDVIYVETSGKVNLDTTYFATTTTYAITNTTATITAATPKGAYTVAVATPAEGGATVTVTVTCTTLPTSGTDTLTLTGTGITNVSGTLSVASDGTTGAVGTITFTMPAANVTDLAVTVTNA